MKKRTIDLGTIQLPAEDFIERATGLIAKRGRGKTGLVKVIEEEMLSLGLPFVAFDPPGLHWGIKSSLNGKKPSGFEVLVIGGAHGDLPLDRQSGRVVARAIANTNASLIIDFKGSSHAAYRQFVADFSDELLDINKVPRLLILEEAPRLLPQKLRPDQTASFDAVARLVLEGRNSGLGCILISQRAATINKDVLTQVDNLIVMGITGPQDRKAIREWVEENADETKLQDFLKGLAGLETREAWLWSPDSSIFRQFRVKDFRTFHPDRTHLRRMGLLEANAVMTDTKKLVELLGTEIKQISEKAIADNPQALRNQIAELKHEIRRLELNRADAQPKAAPDTKIEYVDKPILTDEQIAALVEAAERIQIASNQWDQAIQTVANGRDDLRNIAADILQAIQQGKTLVSGWEKARAGEARSVRAEPARPLIQSRSPAPVKESGDLTGPQQRIIDSIAWMETAGIFIPRRSVIAALSGYSVKSTSFKNPASDLKRHGLIEYPDSQSLCLTDEGRARANPQPSPANTAELHEIIFRKITGAQARILKPLIDAYPDQLDRETLAELAGYSAKSTSFKNPLSDLKGFGFVGYPNSQSAVALPILFIDGDK